MQSGRLQRWGSECRGALCKRCSKDCCAALKMRGRSTSPTRFGLRRRWACPCHSLSCSACWMRNSARRHVGVLCLGHSTGVCVRVPVRAAQGVLKPSQLD